MSKYSLLYVDDDPIYETVRERVEPADFTVTICAKSKDLEQLLRAPDFEYDVALVDYKLDQGFAPPYEDGIKVTRELLARNPEMGVVGISGWLGANLGGSWVTVADWVYEGACWFCEKIELENPRDFERTLQILLRQAERSATWRALRRQAGAVNLQRYEGLTEAVKVADRIARLPMNILLLGETGVGKELFARRIHQVANPSAPFVVGNCANLKGELAEITLHGQERHQNDPRAAGFPRAGWFEQANGGTLFLDEIGDLDLQVQASLLRVLQEKKVRRVLGESEIDVDFKLVAATNHDLKAEAESGFFRKDLYFRINGITIEIPPLGQRRMDIPPLVEHFRLKYSSKFGLRTPVRFDDKVMEYLTNRDYPGNVRELENLVQRIIALTDAECPALGEVERLDNLRLTADEVRVDRPVISSPEEYTKVLTEKLTRLLNEAQSSISLRTKAALVREARKLVDKDYSLADSFKVPKTDAHILDGWLKPLYPEIYEQVQGWNRDRPPDDRGSTLGGA
jgi:DNA-binding NtrC family response regulator